MRLCQDYCYRQFGVELNFSDSDFNEQSIVSVILVSVFQTIAKILPLYTGCRFEE